MASLTLVAGAVDLGCDGATDASDDPASHNAAKTTATNRLIGSLQVPWILHSRKA